MGDPRRVAAILDTGPLVAFLDADEQLHPWARRTFQVLQAPLVTCEAVIAETLYLVRTSFEAVDKVLEWIGRGALVVDFNLGAECAAVRRLMRKYRDLPMSFADACLVRMAEARGGHAICTLDSDFHVYRKEDGSVLSLVMPDPGGATS